MPSYFQKSKNYLKNLLIKETGQIDKDKGGATGEVFYSGILNAEEYNNDLTGIRGYDEYDKMLRRNAVCAQAKLALTQPILGATFNIEPASDVAKDKEIAEWFEYQVLSNPFFSFRDYMYELLDHLFFGFSVHYIERAYDTNSSLWNIKRLSHRKQRTILDATEPWKLDENDELIAVSQHTWKKQIWVNESMDRQNLLIFTNFKKGKNFEGCSMLRPAYKYSLVEDKILRIEAIAIERSGIGILKAGEDPQSKLSETAQGQYRTTKFIAAVEKVLKSLKADEHSYIVQPPGYMIDMMDMKAGTYKNGLDILNYCNHAILNIINAAWMLLGQTGEGSRAVGDTQKELYYAGGEVLVKYIEEEHNRQLLTPMTVWNFGAQYDAPRMRITNLTKKDWLKRAQTAREMIDFLSMDTIHVLENDYRKDYLGVEEIQYSKKSVEPKTIDDNEPKEPNTDTDNPEPSDDRIDETSENMMHVNKHDHICLQDNIKQFFRELSPVELAIGVDKIDAEILEPEYKTLKESLIKIQDEMKREAVLWYLKKSRKGFLTVEDVKNIEFPNQRNKLMKAFKEHGKKMYQEGIRRAKWEDSILSKAYVRFPGFKFERTEPPTWRLSAEDQLDKMTDDPDIFEKYMNADYLFKAKKMEQRIIDEVIQFTITEYQSGRMNKENIVNSFRGLSDKVVEDFARQITNKTWETGRVTYFTEQDYQYVMYSAIRDDRVCSVCAPLDQKVAIVDSDMADALATPNPNCEGTAERCRCMRIFMNVPQSDKKELEANMLTPSDFK